MMKDNICAQVNSKDKNVVDVAICPEDYHCSGNHNDP